MMMAERTRARAHSFTILAISCARWQRRADQGLPLTSFKEKLTKLRAKVVSHDHYIAFPMAEVAIPRKNIFQEIRRSSWN